MNIAGQELEAKVEQGTKGVVFELQLPVGKTEPQTWPFNKNSKAGGGYFTEVVLLP